MRGMAWRRLVICFYAVVVATYGADNGRVQQRQEEDKRQSANEKAEFEPFEVMARRIVALGRRQCARLRLIGCSCGRRGLRGIWCSHIAGDARRNVVGKTVSGNIEVIVVKFCESAECDAICTCYVDGHGLVFTGGFRIANPVFARAALQPFRGTTRLPTNPSRFSLGRSHLGPVIR